MNLAERVRRNSIFSLLTYCIRLVANFLVFVGIARLYGPEEFGQFTAAHALSGIFLLLADYGFDSLLVMEIARNKDKAEQVIHTLFSTKILFAVCATVLMIITASVDSASHTTRVLMYLFSFYMLFSAIMNFFFYLFRGYQAFQQETKISFVINTALLVSAVILGLLHVPLYIVAVAFIGTRVLGIIMGISAMGSRLDWKQFRFSLARREDLLKINIFGLYGVFGTILFTLDTVLLSFLTSDLQVGIYQSVIKLTSVGLLVCDVLVYAILPPLSASHDADHAQWIRLARYSHRTLVFAGTFISFFMIVFPSELIVLVYGPNRFDVAAPLLRMFGCLVFIRYCSETAGLMLTSSNRQSRRLVVVIVATVVNFIANILLIPRYGVTGAAIISLVTNIIVMIGYYSDVQTIRTIWQANLTQYVPLFIATLLGGVFWGGRSLDARISIPLSALILLSAILFIGFSKQERYRLLLWKAPSGQVFDGNPQ